MSNRVKPIFRSVWYVYIMVYSLLLLWNLYPPDGWLYFLHGIFQGMAILAVFDFVKNKSIGSAGFWKVYLAFYLVSILYPWLNLAFEDVSRLLQAWLVLLISFILYAPAVYAIARISLRK